MTQFCYVLSTVDQAGDDQSTVLASGSWNPVRVEALDLLESLLTSEGEHELTPADKSAIELFAKRLDAARPTPSLHVEFDATDPKLVISTAVWIP